jgi:predicted transcriptional regulator
MTHLNCRSNKIKKKTKNKKQKTNIMSRKELYAKIKELGAADAIKTKFGDNYTRVSNANLEDFLRDFGKKTPKKRAASKKVNKEAMVKLLSTLQAKRVLTAKEAEEVAALL